MTSRIGDAVWLDAANRLAAALFAVFAAVATLTKLVGGRHGWRSHSA